MPPSNTSATPAGDRVTDRIAVLLVDDSNDITEMMRLIFDGEPSTRCVGCLDSADRLIDEARSLRPDIVLLDATMPGRLPFDAMSEMAQTLPQVRTIIFSGRDDPADVESALDAGAWGYLSKDADPSTILRAVRSVAAGRVWLPGHDQRR